MLTRCGSQPSAWTCPDVFGGARAATIFVAMPVAFAGAAPVGAVLEMAVIRRLASRPLDTLLAIWGVSLILQQAARLFIVAVAVLSTL